MSETKDDQIRKCRSAHLKWLEPNVYDGENNENWDCSNENKYVSAALCDYKEFNVESNELIDIIQYCSILRIEFVTKVCHNYLAIKITK